MRFFILLTALFVLFSAQKASAQQNRCVDVRDLFQAELLKIGGSAWAVHQLKRDGEVWYLIFTEISKNGKVMGDAKWIVANRHSEARPDSYCILGTGNVLQPLVSLHNSSGEERFGMPGSGHPRCSRAGEMLSGFKVRAWASRELGESLIIDLSTESGHAFQLLASYADNHWVLLETKDRKSGTCYLDRGSDSDYRQFTVVPPSRE